ncbi:GpE family phage tail protein [Psychromonas aquimarina]|uniref:GpE family phage tail protein n=1 Tax=Psychromonas aquimarina TaxID=444919 RepID=UPI00316ACCA3
MYRGGQFFRAYRLPERIESIYADLAIIFHWQPSEIDKLTLDELLLFRDEADKRSSTAES